MDPSNVSALTRMTRGFLVLGLVVAVGVVGYLLTGWSLLDALYMVVITIFGVGYGEVRNLDSPELKVFTMLLIIAGCSALIYILGGFFQLIAEGELNRALGRLRMTKQIKELSGHVIVCGYGRIGRVLAGDLRAAGVTVVVVDPSDQRCQTAKDAGYLIFQGDATQDECLLEVGVHRAKALCSVLPNDALNVFITLSARSLCPTLNIIARGEDPNTESKLLSAGASHVVLPSAIGATRMADMVVRPQAMDYLSDTGLEAIDSDLSALGLRLVSIELDASAEGHSVGDLEREARVSLMVVALRRTGGDVVDKPALDVALHERDTVILIAHAADAENLRVSFASQARRLSYRGASVMRS